jgi:hypothetical protein
VYVSGVTNTRKFGSKFMVEMKGKIQMLVSETANGIWAIIGDLRSLDVSEGVRFHIFSIPEDRCVLLLLKTSANRMPEAEVGRSNRPCTSICRQSCNSSQSDGIRTPRRTVP